MKKTSAFVSALVALAVSLPALALDKGADGFYMTGSATRVKHVAFITANVYDVWHYAKALPSAKSRQAIIDLDADKKIVWRMRRDVDADKIKNALSEAYALNGYGDKAKIGQFTSAVTSELKEKAVVNIRYDAASKTTSIKIDGAGSASVPGVDFMKATWSIWFGKMPDQPKLGDSLISNL
jgi:hypothetical protein